MYRILLLLTFLISPCLLFAQNISFQISAGFTNNSIWKDTAINIRVVVYAPGRITAVTAAAGGRETALSDGGSSTYSGRLSLQGLPGDTLTLVIAARDTLNNSGDSAITFIYRPLNDPAVSLTVDSLADLSVARPYFLLHAQSAGNTIAAYYNNGTSTDYLITTAKDSLPVLDLSDHNGKKLTIKLVATDSLGRTARKQLTAFIESSPYLTEYTAITEPVADIRYHKALIAQKATGYPILVDLTTGQRSAPLVNYPLGDNSFITPYGIMFKSSYIYEWKNGQIIYQSDGDDLKVTGDYAAWIKLYSLTLMRRNLATGVTDSIVIPNTYGESLDVGASGMVTFDVRTSTIASDIYKYDSGQVRLISSSSQGGLYKYYPLTDGHNIIYSSGNYTEPDTYLYFYNGRSNTNVLLGSSNSASYSDYQLNNGFAAFITDRVVLRDTLGNMIQVNNIPRGTNSIDLLNNKGEMMLTNADSGRFFINSQGLPRRIASIPGKYGGETWSRSFFDGTNWYLLIGKTLFRVNLDTLPANHITSFEKRVKPDSTLHFTEQDFSSHFSGTGALITVKIISIPSHGALKFSGGTVYNTLTIPASKLSTLKYTPDSAYTGKDTLRWIAYNGVDYTTDTASVFITVKDSIVVVPQPVVTGLSSSYCAAADSQQVKIANLPSANTGIQVVVLLDSTTVLTVAADSTFYINPAILSPGKHTLAVTFSHDTIQKQLSLSFNITPAVTPALDLTVNVNPIITDTIPVVITATNVTGGGKQPLYTFAWDRGFINKLQLESNNNTVTVSPVEFKLGDNVVYARVRTSDQCYTAQTGIDSITINKTNITAIVDVDNPGQPVTVYPNPFREQVSISNLQPSKTYIISLYDIQGKLILHQRVVNKTKTAINPPAAQGSIYILRVYDEKGKKLLGTQKLVGY